VGILGEGHQVFADVFAAPIRSKAARAEATSLMECLREVLDLYFDTNCEEQRQTLLNTCVYLNQLLYPLIRRETGALP
uniref:hypothetical protein n=1 Tax=Pseudomonas parasichuanensis TaxID=2892329 RepID=UPI001F213DD4